MVDLAKTPEEMSEDKNGLPAMAQDKYPCGLSICLNDEVLKKLESLDEVVEAYYTIGHHFNLFIKVMCCSIDALEQLLIKKIQVIDEIQSTETMISLQMRNFLSAAKNFWTVRLE